MAQRHGPAGVEVQQDHMEEEHVARLEDQWVALINHRPVRPHRGVDGTHAVATGVEAVLPVAGIVQDSGVGGEHLT